MTPRLAEKFPSWTQIRKNKESIGHQLLNVPAQLLEDIEDCINQALNNRFIGTAILEEVYSAYKIQIPDYIRSDSTISSITGDGTISILEENSLRSFFTNNQDGTAPDKAIFDFDNKICYLRKGYTSITIVADGITYSTETINIHPVWNPFDEFALMLGLRRKITDAEVESNVDLKERSLNVFRFPPSSTKQGLVNWIGQSLDLVNLEVWPEDTPSFKLIKAFVSKGSILLDYTRIHDSQIESTDINETPTLQSKVSTFYRSDLEYDLNGVQISKEIISLSPGSKNGSITSPLIDPGNLKEWSAISMVSTGAVTIDLVGVDPITKNEYIISSGTTVPAGINIPIKVRANLSRVSVANESPTLSSLTLEYKNKATQVRYIYGVRLNSLFETETSNTFRKTLFDDNDMPLDEMNTIVDRLMRVAPIFWDMFKWDEAYWDVVDDNRLGLSALPNKWDPSITEAKIADLQSGIGYGDDLNIKFYKDDWKIKVHNGYYFVGNSLDEYYLYAAPEIITNAGPIESLDVPISKQGAPVIIKAGEKYLTQVAFLDENFEYTISNTETIVGTGNDTYFLNYSNVDQTSVFISGYTVSSVDRNKITLTAPIPEGTEVTMSYKVIDSFVIKQKDDATNTITFSSPQSSVSIVYESQDKNSYYTENQLELNPQQTTNVTGFIYLTNTKEQPSSLIASASPDLIKADGIEVSTIVVDVVDRWGNPVLNHPVSAAASGGSIVSSGSYYNRYVFRYTSNTTAEEKALTFTASNDSGQTITTTVNIEAR
jgi:hypothetical protein